MIGTRWMNWRILDGCRWMRDGVLRLGVRCAGVLPGAFAVTGCENARGCFARADGKIHAATVWHAVGRRSGAWRRRQPRRPQERGLAVARADGEVRGGKRCTPRVPARRAPRGRRLTTVTSQIAAFTLPGKVRADASRSRPRNRRFAALVRTPAPHRLAASRLVDSRVSTFGQMPGILRIRRRGSVRNQD